MSSKAVQNFQVINFPDCKLDVIIKQLASSNLLVVIVSLEFWVYTYLPRAHIYHEIIENQIDTQGAFSTH